MGLLDTLGRFGHRVVGGIDNAAYNSLGGGLLGSALPPQQGYPMDEVPRPQQGGLIGDGATAENPMQQAPQQPQQAPPQQWQPNPQQRAQLRGQYLGAIGSALSKAAYGQPLDLAGSLQEYQRNAVGQIQAGQQAQLGQQRQRMLAQFQQEAAQAGGNPQALQAVAAKWAAYFPKEVQDLGASVKALAPKEDEVVGAPFPGVGPDGKPAMLQHTKSGKVIPIQDYAPQQTFGTDGANNIFNHSTGQIVHSSPSIDQQGFAALLQKHNGDAAAALEEMKGFGKNDPKDNMVDLATRAAAGDQSAAAALKLLKPGPAVNVNAGLTALDRETKQFGSKYEKGLSEANSQLEKIADARVMINGPAEAQALGIPKVLTALVSGAGSGVRITQAELNQIAGARGVAGNFEGWLNNINGKGKLTSTQQAQLTTILNDVQSRLLAKREIHNAALNEISGAGSRDQIIAADKSARERLSAMETPQQQKQQQSYRQTAVGPGGHRIGSNDGNTWFDVQTGKKL